MTGSRESRLRSMGFAGRLDRPGVTIKREEDNEMD
jgi:hypothetical protein